MKYPLFLSDFDGTLVRKDGTISQKNIAAIEKYRAAGGIFAVVTGRMLSSIRPRLRELGLEKGLVVAYQGGVVADIETGELLKNDGFSPSQAEKIVSFLEREDRHVHVYMDDLLYSNRDDESLRMYEKICGVKGIPVKEPLSALIAREQKPVNKILVMLPPEEKAAIIARMQREFGDFCYATASADVLAEALPAGVSKASAVDFLAARYGVSREETAAIGDQLNDLPMIERAGGKFAVANAEAELRKIATVVPSSEEDGVAAALEIAMGEHL